MRELHKRAMYTAKQYVMGTAESTQPICSLLAKHHSITKENIIMLMYRL